MTSLLTNYASMSAVRTLAATQAALATTQGQISTGLRVASAKDNAAYWSIATSMKTRIGELQAVNDGLDVTSGILSTTSAAFNQIQTLMQGISKDIVSAQTSGVDQSKLAIDIAAKQQGIVSAAKSASYNGVNWLVTQDTAIYSATSDTTWAGTYADVWQSHANTPIAYTTHATDTTETVFSLGSKSSSAVTTSYDDNGTYTPSTGHFAQHVVGGTTTNTGDTNNYQDVSVLLTTGAATIFNLQPLNLFEDNDAKSGGVVAHATFTDGPHDPLAFLVPPTVKSTSITGADVLDQRLTLSGGIQTTVLTFDASTLSKDDLATVGAGFDNALAGLQNAMTFVGTMQNEIDGSKAINTAISDALKTGVGSLVDADMNQASTRLMALQTQQQLGVQALSVANDNSQVIMKLFGP